MGVLGAEAAQNEESAVHNVFKGGAEEVNKVCGSEWVNTAAIDQAVARETSGASRKRSLGGLVVAVMVGVWLL